ncbi:hypothetical protein [Burkholderia metallica]|uniref:Uncharacterized protein n=1 Tax=Burkholderia metallica TaxID=488729 RepID=A0ABT8PHN2_9BURK|nr:hypothetical protein [Burkholderia metallica]MCA8002746.1 hypothetical protein [Burkholderia metallica]MDN7934646.1 hypothetical protein [Burkholderia metallica]
MLQPNEEWIEQAEAAIRKITPAAAKVVGATRGFAVLGREGVLTARLADGAQWQIDGESVRQLFADDVAERVRLHDSFQ